MSMCEFQDGTYEFYLQDRETGEEVCLSGNRKLTDEERRVLEKIAPPCVFARYTREKAA